MQEVDPALKRAEAEKKKRDEELRKRLGTDAPPVDDAGGEPPEPVDEPVVEEPETPDAPDAPAAEPETPTPEPPDDAPDAGEPPPESPDDGSDVADMKAQLAELRKKLNARDGQHGNEKQQWDREKQQLVERIAILTADLSQKGKPGGDDAPGDGQDAPAEDAFDAFVDKFVKTNPEIAADYEDDELRSWLRLEFALNKTQPKQSGDSMREELDALKAQAEDRSLRDFTREIEAQAPGFTEANGEYDRTGKVIRPPADPGWVAFLDTPVNAAVSDETWREFIGRAGTPKAYAGAFAAYKESSGGSEAPSDADDPSAPPRPSLADQAGPKGRAGSSSSTPPAVLKRADYDKFRMRVSAPGYVMTADDRKKKRAFEVAAMQGRLR